MGTRIDMFIDRDLRRQAKYTGLILFMVNFICIFSMIVWGIMNYNLGIIIFLSCLLLFVGLITLILTIAMRRRTFRKIVFSETEIRVLSNNSKLLNERKNIEIKEIKKVSLGMSIPSGGIYGGSIRAIDVIVICYTEDKIEKMPRWSDYSKNPDFLFIETRPGLELLLNRYLPNVKILEKD